MEYLNFAMLCLIAWGLLNVSDQIVEIRNAHRANPVPDDTEES